MSTRALSVALPSEVIYVSGTVNGTAYTWTRMDDAWRATVERAADERYRVSLTAVNSLGTSASYELTLYYGLQGSSRTGRRRTSIGSRPWLPRAGRA